MLRVAVLLSAACCALRGQGAPKNFVAGMCGLAILSGDAQAKFSQGAVASLYAPKDGLAVNIAAGRYLNNFVSAQANYIFNRTDVTLSGVGGNAFYSAFKSRRQHQFVFDGMLHVRPLSSRIRPYLSAGFAMVRASRNEVAFEDTAPAVPAKTAA